MKKLLVKLNRPVLINESQCEQIKMKPVYGFLAPNDEDDNLEEEITTYIGYLAAVHAWSTYDDVEFSVLNDEIWIDSEGEPHSVPDEWAFNQDHFQLRSHFQPQSHFLFRNLYQKDFP